MSVLTKEFEEEPPISPNAAMVGRISRFLLLAVCAGPIAVFPIGLAYKGYMHFFGAETPPALIQTIEAPELPG
jgi:hypothetical protein